MAIFTREIPDEQVELFLLALAEHYGFGRGEVRHKPRGEGEALTTYVGRMLDDEWKQIVKQYQEKERRKIANEMARREAAKTPIIDVEIKG